MKKIFYGLTLLLFCGCNAQVQQDRIPVMEYADLFVGTGDQGHTFPGATLPFGMIQVGTSNYSQGWAWCSGYHQCDTVMQGFAHTHLSGTGLSGLGDILIIPTTGDLKLVPGRDENPDDGYSSRWTHQKEVASPGYYSVHLDDYDVYAQMTASKRVGFHHYTFNSAGNHYVVIDPTHQLSERVQDTEIEIVSDRAVRGFKHSIGAGGDRHVYFYAEFSKPFTESGVAIDGKPIEGSKAADKSVAGYVKFDGEAGEAIEAKVALSFVDYDGAKKNFDAEAKGISFADQRASSEATWEKHLSKIEVRGGTGKDLRTFYSALYHALLVPNLISDVDGRYIVEGKEYQGDGNQYSTFSTWDTFRAQHPLLTILEPEYTAEIVNSLISRQTVAGVGLPIWELTGYDNGCMPSYTPVSVVVDAVMKDIPGINKEDAYRAVQETSMMDWKKSSFVRGELLIPWIKKINYIPSYIWESVSQTVEYAYQDWCIYQLGKSLGKSDDTAYYLNRSRSYLNHYDPEQGYLVPKDTMGNFLVMDTHDWESVRPHYITGNIWGYTTFVPHEIDKIIELKGGKEPFCDWMDSLINDTIPMRGEVHVDVSGFIGRYGHGDEPSHHMPYLYNYGGQPYKTQELVRRVIRLFYHDTPEGLVNNEDCGQMSSWFVMSSMGLYPFCPGSNEYTLTSPLFDEVTIHQDNGAKFVINSTGGASENFYIQSLKANGKEYNSHLITHKMITDGLELDYTLSSEPNKEWASSK